MRIIGKIESLWRYPVKSMRGEELEEAFAGFSGIYGDRLFAFTDALLDEIEVFVVGPRLRRRVEVEAELEGSARRDRAGIGHHSADAAVPHHIDAVGDIQGDRQLLLYQKDRKPTPGNPPRWPCFLWDVVRRRPA